jgi:hypothetical protein
MLFEHRLEPMIAERTEDPADHWEADDPASDKSTKPGALPTSRTAPDWTCRVPADKSRDSLPVVESGAVRESGSFIGSTLP